MTLERDPVPVIILAENLNAYENEMAQYGLDPDDPFLYPAYTLSGAYATSLQLPNGTQWCVVGKNADRAAMTFLQNVYGYPVDIHVALAVQHSDVAIDPKLLNG